MAANGTIQEPAQREAAPGCVHHWVIESPNGATSRGICRRCGAAEDFENTIKPKGWNGQRSGETRSK